VAIAHGRYTLACAVTPPRPARTLQAGLKLPASAQKAILSALSERDEAAIICRNKDGHPEPDPELRETESVPLAERIEEYFAREVPPHVADASGVSANLLHGFERFNPQNAVIKIFR
jgi:type I restriction enzyme M protein